MHCIGDLLLADTVDNFVVFGIISEIDKYKEMYKVIWFMRNENILIREYTFNNISALKKNLNDYLNS
jgi:hypothetical protein